MNLITVYSCTAYSPCFIRADLDDEGARLEGTVGLLSDSERLFDAKRTTG